MTRPSGGGMVETGVAWATPSPSRHHCVEFPATVLATMSRRAAGTSARWSRDAIDRRIRRHGPAAGADDMNRHIRPADVAEFKREVARTHLNVYLVLRDALQFWHSNIRQRRPMCISCRWLFTDGATQPDLFLLAAPSAAPTACSVSGKCCHRAPRHTTTDRRARAYARGVHARLRG